MARSQGTATTELTLNTAGSNTFESGRLSLRANFSWAFAGNAIYAACQWGMVVAVARLGSPEKVGQFALGLAIAAPIVILTNLSLRNVQASDAIGSYGFGDYLKLRGLSAFLAVLVIAGIAIVGGYGRETGLVIFGIGVAKAFEAVSDIFYGLIQLHEQMNRIAKSMALKGMVSIVTLSSILYVTGSLVWSIAGLAASWLLVLIVYDVRNGLAILASSPGGSLPNESAARCVGIVPLLLRRSEGAMCSLARLAMPLGLASALTALTASIPKYFTAHVVGQHEFGIFAALLYLLVGGNTLISAVAQSALPRLSKHYAVGDLAAYRSLLLKLVGFAAFLGVMALASSVSLGRVALSIVYGPEYAAHMEIFHLMVLATGFGFVTWVLDAALVSSKRFRIQFFIQALTAFSVFLSSLALIPQLGLLGATCVVLIGVLIQVLMKGMVIGWLIHKEGKGRVPTSLH